MSAVLRANGRWFPVLGLVVYLVVGGFSGRPEALAGTEGAQWVPVTVALGATITEGRPTALIITQESEPASRAFRADLTRFLNAIPSKRPIELQLATLSADEYPEKIRELGIQSTPAILVYGGEEGRLKLVDYRVGIEDAAQAALWLDGAVTPGLGAARESGGAARVEETQYDAAVGRAQYVPGAGPPSAQGPAAPAPAPPVANTPAPIAAPPVPVYSAPVGSPTVVSPPSHTFVVQPQPATLVVGPAPQPNIIFAASAPAMPNISVAQPPVGAAPQVNLFTQPSAAFAPPSAQSVYVTGQPVAAAPAVWSNQPVVAQSPVTTALIAVIAPSLIDRLLGCIGESLAKRKNPRVAAAPVMMPISLPSTVALAPQAYVAVPSPAAVGHNYVPTPPAYPAAAVPPASVSTAGPAQYAPQPSPQDTPRWRGWFHRR